MMTKKEWKTDAEKNQREASTKKDEQEQMKGVFNQYKEKTTTGKILVWQ